MSDLAELERAAALVERAMDEAYSRYLTENEEERVAGVTAAIERTLALVPETMRPYLLDWFLERYEAEVPRAAAPSGGAQVAALKMEIDTLRREVATLHRRSAATGLLASAMVGPEAPVAAVDGSQEAVQAEAVRLLSRFTLALADHFLAPPGKQALRAEAMDQVRAALSAASSGTDPLALDQVLNLLKRNIAAYIEARKPTCREGALYLLQQVDPAVLEEKVGDTWIAALRYKELWQEFDRRYGELIRDEDIYASYFEPYFHRTINQIFSPAGGRK